MTIKDFEGGKIVEIAKAFESRAKTLNSFYALVFFFTGCYASVSIFEDNGLRWLIFHTLFTLIFFLAAYRFINKAVMFEKIFFDQDEFCLIRGGFLIPEEHVIISLIFQNSGIYKNRN